MSQTYHPEKPRQGIPLGLCSCLPVALVLLLVTYLLLRGLGAFLIIGDRLKTVDAVVVLGGGGEHRVQEAVRLVEEKYGSWLILTEPGQLESGGMGSDAFRTTAVDAGLSPHAILITEQTSSSTYEEAQAVRHLMEAREMKSVIVVTDPFHTQRTRQIFRDAFRSSGLTVRVHPVPDHWYRSSTWFFSPEGWAHTLREYLKLAGYWAGIYENME